jgi:type I restriction enzyme S subunit
MKPTRETRKLGEIFDFINGRGFKKSEWKKSGVPIIRIQNLNNLDGEFNYFQGEYDKKIEINNGDLLFSWSGTVGSSFGSHIWDQGKGVLNQHIFKILHSENIDRKYAFYALRHITVEVEKQVNGAVGLVHITKEKLKNFEIPLPSLPEQKRIVAILNEAVAAIAIANNNAEKNLRNAREVFDSRLQSIFTSDASDWESTTLENALASQPRNGWSPPAINHSDEGVPVLTLSSVTRFIFRPDKVKYTSAKTDPKRHYWVKNGDFLITRSNTPELVGHVAIANSISQPTIYPDLIMRMVPAPDRIITKFLYYQMRTSSLRNEIMSRAQGANPTMKKISKGAVQTLPIVVPSLSIQKNITTQLDELLDETQQLETIYQQKIAYLEELKKSILQKAFCGELKGASQ